uniref:(California timema) hypothetical protein n=1 Tax=Timema californicum TaxID=61474 RepID=A0A7R9J4G9_TIMCA|nr:unnamed protein product [Timema californicum]
MLSSEPLAIVQALPLTNGNYTVAWDLVVRRYDNKRLIVAQHIDAILQIPSVPAESTTALRVLLSTLRENVAALHALEIPVVHWDLILIHILSNKLDIALRAQWERTFVDSELPTVDSFINFLERYCRSFESLASYKVKPHSRSSFSARVTHPSTILLSTALVEAQDVSGSYQVIRVLLDSGSQASFITDQCLSRLGLSRRKASLALHGLSHTPLSVAKGVSTCFVRPIGLLSPSLSIDVFVLPRITGHLSSTPLSSPTWSHVSNLKLADPTCCTPGPIDMLIGAETFSHIITGRKLEGESGTPCALETVFGWVLTGRVQQPSMSPHTSSLDMSSFFISSSSCTPTLTDFLWKARLHGYEEAAKLFRQIDDEKSPEFGKFLGLVKKFVIDSNAVAQEKGLEAVLAYVENYALAGKTVGEVMSGIVAKCIAAPKTKTKELAVQITLMYVEIEKQELVQEELIKGMEHKNPRIVSACISAITQALREFGSKVINIKPLVKKMPKLLEDRDKGVRDEAKAMVVQMFRWIGPALRPQLSALKPVQVTELEAEFEKVSGKVTPTRYLKSQQQKQAEVAAAAVEDGGDDGEDEEGDNAPEIDLYELIDPVDILSKIPKDFFEKLEAKKWQERKEAVDLLEQLSQTPKLESGDYGDIVRALKKIISKDSNVMVVATAGKCLTGLANGLKKRFQPYAGACIPSILEKFREKKQNVLLALREAIDAIFQSTTIEAVQEDILAALENKNPSVKAETASFLARCFTRCTPAMLNKKVLKAYTIALLKTLNEPDPTVRDSAADALGTAMKVVGEKAIMPFMTDLDNSKLTKIKECCEKAVMLVKAPKVTDRSNSAPTKAAAKSAGSAAPKPVKRPTTSGSGSLAAKKPVQKKSASTVQGKGKPVSKPVEKELSIEEVEERAAAVLPDDVVSGLCDGNWKTRLAAVEQFVQVVNALEESDISTQVLIRTLNKKPGLKDANAMVAKARLEAVKMLAEMSPVSSVVLEHCVTDIVERLGDIKVSAQAGEVLTVLAEATKLDLVATEVFNFAFTQKSPKLQQEALNWVNNAILEFGFVLQSKPLMENVKKALAATNPAVRTAAISLIGTLYLYIGDDLRMFFDTDKPAIQQQIYAEFDKQSGNAPPAPTRGLPRSKKDAEDEEEDDDDDDVGSNVAASVNVNELMPRVDISTQITEVLIIELSDKDWKVRNEALMKLSNIIAKEKFITNNLGELPLVLAKRLVDSNGKIAATAITISQQLGTAMGSQCKMHVRTLFPGFLQGMGDSKTWVRSAAIACINTWGDQCGYKEFFDGEMIADALKSGNPGLRTELWTWLADKLPTIPPKSIPKDELVSCLPYLYSNMEDRNPDVRKMAQEAVLGFMMHLGLEAMLRATDKLSLTSQHAVRAILDKVYPNMPSKPLPKKKTESAPSATGYDDGEPAKAAKAGGSKPATVKTVKGKGGAATATAAAKVGRKKDEDADTSPLLQVNNLKHQRSIDEQKLKVLKWNFTTPREEFVELLKDQMLTANVNKGLITNMFHSDFKCHLKAIESLSEDLPDNGRATIANLDLILKWMTLRFFDTNPSVLLKGLEYLQTVFLMLVEEGHQLFDTEASAFIPYLILKIGDPKDLVRNGVKSLFKHIQLVYSATKTFSYVMEGLKSKNARQRTECLDLLGTLIGDYGMTVCLPSPAAALKELARQISDRDNSVRNAALNCVVQAYFLEGDRVYKMIGQISDKDLSLLEERIKRASKNRTAVRTTAKPVVAPQPQRLVRQGSDNAINREPPPPREESPPPPPPVMSKLNGSDTKPQDDCVASLEVGNKRKRNSTSSSSKQDSPVCSRSSSPPYGVQHTSAGSSPHLSLTEEQAESETSPPKPRPVSGPFGLDLSLLERLESHGVELHAPKLHEFDFGEILESKPVELRTTKKQNPGMNTGVRTVLSPPRPTVTSHNSLAACTTTEQSLHTVLYGLTSPDSKEFHTTVGQLDLLLQSDRALVLTDYADQFMGSIMVQLALLKDSNRFSDLAQVAVSYRLTFMLLLSFYHHDVLAKRVSRTVLKDFIEEMVGLLVDRRMEELDMTNQYQYIRVINLVVVRVVELSDHTIITW